MLQCLKLEILDVVVIYGTEHQETQLTDNTGKEKKKSKSTSPRRAQGLKKGPQKELQRSWGKQRKEGDLRAQEESSACCWWAR